MEKTIQVLHSFIVVVAGCPACFSYINWPGRRGSGMPRFRRCYAYTSSNVALLRWWRHGSVERHSKFSRQYRIHTGCDHRQASLCQNLGCSETSHPIICSTHPFFVGKYLTCIIIGSNRNVIPCSVVIHGFSPRTLRWKASYWPVRFSWRVIALVYVGFLSTIPYRPIRSLLSQPI
jgi:hypothetical protein